MRERRFRYSRQKPKSFLADESAATAIEYALIASLLSIAIMTGMLALSSGTGGVFTYIFDRVSPALRSTKG